MTAAATRLVGVLALAIAGALALAQPLDGYEYPPELDLHEPFRVVVVPPEARALEPYALVRDNIGELLANSEVTPSDVILAVELPEHVRPPRGDHADERELCGAVPDGQKARVSGGSAPHAPALLDANDDGELDAPGPVYVLDGASNRSDLTIDLAGAADFTIVLIDDFLFERDGGSSDDPSETFVGEGAGHGNLVLLHTLALLGEDPPADLQSLPELGSPLPGVDAPDARAMEVPLPDGGTATIVAIDTDFEMGAIVTAVAAADAQWGDASDAAINMSWNLVSCRLLHAYEANDDPHRSTPAYASYVEFLYDVAQENADAAIFVALYEAFLELGGEEAADHPGMPSAAFVFRVLLAAAEHQANREIVGDEGSRLTNPAMWFGSAGNHGLMFALPPASFVNAIGACQFTSTSGQMEHAPWSNSGSPNVAGAWFRPHDRQYTDDVPYGGTSFASPLAAMSFAAHGTLAPLQDCATRTNEASGG